MLYHDYGRYDWSDTGDILGAGVFLVSMIILAAGGLLFNIFYLITMSRALERCSPESRKMSPGSVWLMLVPILGIIWQYMVVDAVSSSIGREFRKRGMVLASDRPHYGVGLTSCLAITLYVLTFWIPFIGSCIALPTSLTGLVCLIIFWVKMSGMSRELV
jgi:uncharacterized membrane protein HdeD (DUF308 family)